jgi:hypothetical protein
MKKNGEVPTHGNKTKIKQRLRPCADHDKVTVTQWQTHHQVTNGAANKVGLHGKEKEG